MRTYPEQIKPAGMPTADQTIRHSVICTMLTWMRNFLGNTAIAEQSHRWREARLAALRGVLGEDDGTVWRPPSALQRRGFADVLRFRKYVGGIAYVTNGLIGNDRQ